MHSAHIQLSLASEASLQASEAPSLVMKTGGRDIYVRMYINNIYIRQGQMSTRLHMRGIITWQPMQPV